MVILKCRFCNGSGKDPSYTYTHVPCPICKGRGELTVDISEDQLTDCTFCKGSGRDPNYTYTHSPCPVCNGWGFLSRPSEKQKGLNFDSSTNKSKFSNKIFIVHGHDELPKEQLARFLTKMGLDPIILHEQPNQGRTIIEKFEEVCSDVGYAFVIMTADDVGMDIKSYEKMKERDPKYGFCLRARQNVVFELGFFFAKLGRGRICCLLKPDNIEKPTDIDGIVYIPFKEKIEEKYMDIIRELQASKYELNLSKI